MGSRVVLSLVALALLSECAWCMELKRDPFHKGLLPPHSEEVHRVKTVSHIAVVPRESAAQDPLRVVTIPMTGVTAAGEADKEALGELSLAVYKNDKSYKLHYVVRTFNLTGPLPPVGEQILEGNEGVNGTLRVQLKGKWREQESTGTVQWNLASAVSFPATDKDSVQAVKKLIKHPSLFYFTVSTKLFPEGAIRGQL